MLSGVLIAITAGVTFFLIAKLNDNSRAVARNVELAAEINIAQDVRDEFGQYRYWITDLAVSLLRQSEVNANAARERLLRRLDDLAGYRPDVAAALREKIAEFEKAAMHAVELYTDDKRVLGNTVLAQARLHSVTINDRLSTLIDDLHHEVVEGRDRVVADVVQATHIAYLIVAVAIILGMAATLVVLGSILVPLRRIVSAMEGITAGNLNVPIPAAARNEIGTMAHTLRLFRESIVERTRLAEEGDRQRRMIETSIETIPDGFVLYDRVDRLVLCNSKVRDLTPDIADVIVPGVAFVSILRALVDRKIVDLDRQSAEEWIAERLRQHSDPEGFPVYLFNGTWLRISERRTPDGSTVSVLTDITELKQREHELTEKSAALAALSSKLAKYLAPQIYESIFTGQQDVKIVSKRKKLTVCFSDLVGFTEMTDKMESEDLTQLLNYYLTEMSKIAQQYGATIDKYVGDAIIMFFGDPATRGVKEDALACVQMAIAMQERVGELAEEWRHTGILETPLRCRIGIHTGYCTVGNFGSEDRMDYTMVGGTVNLASRLEHEAPPGGVLISFETYAHVKDDMRCEERGHVQIKGIAQPVATYAVVGLKRRARHGRSRLPSG